MSRNKLLASAGAACLVAAMTASTPASAVVINDLFVFGDSYSDTGAFVPLVNPGGTTAVGYLAKNFGIDLTTSKNPDPGTDGVNFAESGARVSLGQNHRAHSREVLPNRLASLRTMSTMTK